MLPPLSKEKDDKMLNDKDLLLFLFSKESRGVCLEKLVMLSSDDIDCKNSALPEIMEALVSGLAYSWSCGASDHSLDTLASELRLLLMAELIEETEAIN